jgi:hypothetical protein
MGISAAPEHEQGEDTRSEVARHLVELVSDGRTVLHAFEINYSGATWEVVVRLRLPEGGD